MFDKTLAGMAVLAAGIIALTVAVMPDADPSLKACTRTISTEADMAALQAQYGPVDYRREELEGIWFDRDGREIGYSENEDETICLTV